MNLKPKYFFWIIFAFTFYWILQLYKPFLMNLVVALLLCVATFGLKRFVDRFIKYNFISSFITIVIFLGIFILPLTLVINSTINDITKINVNQLSKFINESKQQSIELLEQFPSSIKDNAIDSIKSININTIASHAVNISGTIGKIGINFVADFTFILIFLYLFYYYGIFLKNYIIDIIPFDKLDSKEILNEVSGVLKVVFFSTIISMILQGLSFGIAVSFFGFSGILFGVLYGIASIIPVVGGAIVWLPVSFYIYWSGDLSGAIFIALYSMIFIGTIIDNVIKPLIINIVNKIMLKNPVKINDMVIFISILAGLASFGFWGIIIGPTMSAFFIALLRTYQYKFKHIQ